MSLVECAPPMLVVPRIHTELACRAISVAAPSTWNSLPADFRLCENILTFKRHLKTYLDSNSLSPVVLHQAPLHLIIIIIIIIIIKQENDE